ncbi:nitrogen regulatory protein P-II [Alkalidesulfovibrio alkalitolerans DSM 16529]|jgi:nitrogen regulatory protein PII|uniref:Nitrogen regulatory protein P-II n=1 Tax=Alkalidesulfovibrio alkalitolerans DSM 16529 TaxID=1121439 RepID=S7T6X3_9BACT|nr:P-II family nitrogen regulator [Alkalidesulfovibrio alkalitolerans]EPR32842.1 nitrogen regulatory protein P-II [Alkalidesulfovibrio alkalitolerans DSM 16529]
MNLLEGFDCIVTIVNKGLSEPILTASRKAGAEGGTIIFGRGAGIREMKSIFGISIEPEKEILLTLVHESISRQVLEAIVEAGRLETPGTGIAFMLPVKGVAGICHLNCPLPERERKS